MSEGEQEFSAVAIFSIATMTEHSHLSLENQPAHLPPLIFPYLQARGLQARDYEPRDSKIPTFILSTNLV